MLKNPAIVLFIFINSDKIVRRKLKSFSKELIDNPTVEFRRLIEFFGEDPDILEE